MGEEQQTFSDQTFVDPHAPRFVDDRGELSDDLPDERTVLESAPPSSEPLRAADEVPKEKKKRMLARAVTTETRAGDDGPTMPEFEPSIPATRLGPMVAEAPLMDESVDDEEPTSGADPLMADGPSLDLDDLTVREPLQDSGDLPWTRLGAMSGAPRRSLPDPVSIRSDLFGASERGVVMTSAGARRRPDGPRPMAEAVFPAGSGRARALTRPSDQKSSRIWFLAVALCLACSLGIGLGMAIYRLFW